MNELELAEKKLQEAIETLLMREREYLAKEALVREAQENYTKAVQNLTEVKNKQE